MEKKFFAFWPYDQFPYCLGAEITDMYDDGMVSCKGYQGYRFMPIKILPLEAGEQLWKQMRQLEKEYNSEKKELHNKFLIMLKVLAPGINWEKAR